MASSLQRLSLGRGNDVRREILFYSLALAAFHLLHHKGFSMRNLNGRMSRLISKRNERNNKKAILHNQKSTDKREPFFFQKRNARILQFFLLFFLETDESLLQFNVFISSYLSILNIFLFSFFFLILHK